MNTDGYKYKYLFAVIYAFLLIIFTVFTLLEAFVIPKPYMAVANDSANPTYSETADKIINITPMPVSTPKNKIEPVISDKSYKDENISISIERFNENEAVYYIADVIISDVSHLKTAFAKNTFGKNITEKTSVIAKSNNAIFAINGDYCSFRSTGIIIRNGLIYRDIPRDEADKGAVIIDKDGNLEIINEYKVTAKGLLESGVLQCFSFGPALVQNGKILPEQSKTLNPLTAIGQISPLHYVFIVVDGRSNQSKGMNLFTLAGIFVKKGAMTAYNLDGGGSSTMWFNGKIINIPTDGKSQKERNISDIIYIN